MLYRSAGDRRTRSRKADSKPERTGERGLRKFASPEIDPGWLCALAIMLAMLVYIRAVDFPFVYDDHAQIVSNSHIQSWHYVPQFCCMRR